MDEMSNPASEVRIPGWKARILRRLFSDGIYASNLMVITGARPNSVWVRFPKPGGIATAEAPKEYELLRAATRYTEQEANDGKV